MAAITIDESAAPGTPAAGKVVIYAKSDGNLYIKDDAGTESKIPFDPASPGAIGGTTPAAGTFTSVSAGSIDFTAATELTVSSGAITVTQGVHTVDGEGDAADDLATINGGSAEQLLLIRPEHDDRQITLKHGSGNIVTPDGSDYEIPDDGLVLLQYDGSNWRMVASGGGSSLWTDDGDGSISYPGDVDLTGGIFTAKGTTTDGSTNIISLLDSADVERFAVDTDGYVGLTRIEFKDDPTNRWITSSEWKSNLQITLNAAAFNFEYSNTRIAEMHQETIDTVLKCPVFRSDLGKHLQIQAWDSDGIADRLPGKLILRGANSHANNTTNINGGDVEIFGGDGSPGGGNDGIVRLAHDGTSAFGAVTIGVAAGVTGAALTVDGGNIAFATDDTYDFGDSTHRADDIYATNTTIQTSDERLKTNITELPVGIDFLIDLAAGVKSFRWIDVDLPEITESRTVERQVTRPVEVEDEAIELSDGRYVKKVVTRIEDGPVFKEHPLYDENGIQIFEPVVIGRDEDGKSIIEQRPVMHQVPVMETIEEEVIVQKARTQSHHRRHWGVMAQHLDACLVKHGISSDDCAALIYDIDADRYGVRIGELIPLIIAGVADLAQRVEKLEGPQG